MKAVLKIKKQGEFIMKFWVACVLFVICAAAALLSAKLIKRRGVKIACTAIFSLLAAAFAVYIAATFILVSAVD